ncbi:MAG: tRNA pseudouridine(55) synthase TruB [Myxococcota bacterium]
MSRRARRRQRGPHGIVCIDKPAGPTSFRVMRDVQRRLDAGRAGHGGTLDPMATGVLVVLLGEATKLSAWAMGWDKVYRAEVRFGVATDTLDAAGRVVEEAEVSPGWLCRDSVEAALAGFVGDVHQVPPVYSALKREGRTLMSRARAGETIDVEPRPVICHGLEILEVGERTAEVRVHCGKGYYVRSFARDLGEALGLPAHLSALRRERVGPWRVEDAVSPEEITASAVVPIDRALPDVPVVCLGEEEAAAVRNGRQIPATIEAERVLLVDAARTPLAMAVRDDGGRFKVARGLRVPQVGRPDSAIDKASDGG